MTTLKRIEKKIDEMAQTNRYNASEIKNQLFSLAAIKWAIFGVVVLFVMIASIMIVGPRYRVWKQEMKGKAEFAQAEQNRRIVVEEAKARLEAEQLNAQSEVERAKGMAEAMSIENGQLTETYNQYLFIRSLETLAQHGDLPQIIYLPSSGMIPVMDLNQK